MARHLVVDAQVGVFDDVNLARLRPIAGLAKGPECGPDTARALGHVRNVDDEEAVSKGFLAGHADGRAPSITSVGVQLGVGINTPGGNALVPDETIVYGVIVRDIVDEALGGVRAGEEVKATVEVVA